MRIARFLAHGSPVTGRLEGTLLYPFREDGVRDLMPCGDPLPIDGLPSLPPVQPGKIIGVGLNFRDHARERGKPLPPEPLLFLKPPSAVSSHGAPILLPRGIGRVDPEAELAVVIGRNARNLTESDAGHAILGYTCFNDVTARDLQDRDVQFTRAKGFDTFAPLGPWIETEIDPSDLSIMGRVNGVTRQASRTRELIFPPVFLVAFISWIMTLHPGDLIATGTPSGVGPLTPGDTAEVIIEGIGTLSNPVGQAGP